MSTATETRIKVEKPTQERIEQLGIYSWPIWTKEESTFDWHYDAKEMCLFLEGNVTVRTDRGEVSFGKGDLVTFDEGLSCTWHVNAAVRKHYKFG